MRPILLFVMIILLSCQKRDFNNPNDPQVPLEPWKPLVTTWPGLKNAALFSFNPKENVSYSIVKTIGDSVKTIYPDIKPLSLTVSWMDSNALEGYLATHIDELVYEVRATVTGRSVSTTVRFVPDIDSNIYGVVKLGGVLWLNCNIDVKRFSSGIKIAEFTDSILWWTSNEPAWCRVNESELIEGYLYNGFTVTGNECACPDGWRIPYKADFEALISSFDSYSQAIDMLKGGWSTWQSSSNKTDQIEWNAYPSGARKQGLGVIGYGEFGEWWYIDSAQNNRLGTFRLDDGMTYALAIENNGHSIRCVKDL